MWCVIPIAGKGSRLAPLTEGRPKALTKVKGRTILDRLLDNLSSIISDVCLVIPESDVTMLERIGPRRHGMRIHCVSQPLPLGVADAVMKARDIVEPPFAVVMGDVYYDEPLGGYIETWAGSGADGAVLVEPLSTGDDQDVGHVTVHENRIVRIWKGRSDGQATHRVCGMMLLPAATFHEKFRLRTAATGEYELEDVVDGLIHNGMTFVAIQYKGWRCNINTLEDLRSVEVRLDSRWPEQGTLEPSKPTNSFPEHP